MQALLFLNLICPFVMVLVGALLKKHPVSDRNKGNGYSTPTSRKSQEHWDYAQKIAPDIYISLGKYLFIVEIIVSIIFLILQISIDISLTIGTCIGFVFLFYGFYYTDSQIKDKFSDKQTR